jgi:hypothetical protein
MQLSKGVVLVLLNIYTAVVGVFSGSHLTGSKVDSPDFGTIMP